MQNILLIIHVFASIAIIGLVLIQHGKGADAGAAFGGGGGASGSVFGSQGSASFLTKITASLAAIFFITSLTLAYKASHQAKQERSVIQQSNKIETKVPVVLEIDKTDRSGVPEVAE